jgi:hypothetical protein
LAEIQRYQVLETHLGFEVRSYEPHTLVVKPMAGDMGSASYSAFGYLAGYIGGENERGQRIEMTAPVLQQRKGSGFDVSFVMPHDLKEAPNPIRSGMRVEKVEQKLMAAKRFTGSASDALFEKKAKELISEVQASGFKVLGDVLYARYNGPWTPPIIRRNEVLVEIKRN